MNQSKITVSATVAANAQKVWDYYTQPQHIIHWNFADPSWHCPGAENDLRVGGTYKARMEARDGSFGFNFEATYSDLTIGQGFTYGLGDRMVSVALQSAGDKTEIVVTFDPENENPIELQRGGWQAILDSFKTYTENN